MLVHVDDDDEVFAYSLELEKKSGAESVVVVVAAAAAAAAEEQDSRMELHVAAGAFDAPPVLHNLESMESRRHVEWKMMAWMDVPSSASMRHHYHPAVDAAVGICCKVVLVLCLVRRVA